jgi:2-methylisocitrate lyase-like PEP mutase family enzyme
VERAVAGTPTVTRVAELGVRRVSTGSALFNVTYRALRDAATLFADR